MSIPLLPNSPKKAQRGHSPHLLHHVITTLTIPARKEIPHPAIHDPHHTKEMKETTPKGTSNLTMKKKMIDGFIALLAHTTPIHHNHSSLVKIIQSENPSKSSRPHKKTHSEGNFNLPNALPWERQPSPFEPSRRRGEHIKNGANLKNLLLERVPAKPVHPPPPPPPRVDGTHTRNHRKPPPLPPLNPEPLVKKEHSSGQPRSKSAYYHSPKPPYFWQYGTKPGKTPSKAAPRTKYHAKT
jgi:hypothetical protein